MRRVGGVVKSWHIVIPGAPKGRQDPQAVSFGGVTRLVQRKQTRTYEATVAGVVGAAMAGSPLIDQPVRLDILAVFPRPGRLAGARESGGLILYAARPDRDNIEKAVQDGLRAVWRDDYLVAMGTTVKAYAERDGVPRLELWLTPIEGAVFIGGLAVDLPAPPPPARKPKAVKS